MLQFAVNESKQTSLPNIPPGYVGYDILILPVYSFFVFGIHNVIIYL